MPVSIVHALAARLTSAHVHVPIPIPVPIPAPVVRTSPVETAPSPVSVSQPRSTPIFFAGAILPAWLPFHVLQASRCWFVPVWAQLPSDGVHANQASRASRGSAQGTAPSAPTYTPTLLLLCCGRKDAGVTLLPLATPAAVGTSAGGAGHNGSSLSGGFLRSQPAVAQLHTSASVGKLGGLGHGHGPAQALGQQSLLELAGLGPLLSGLAVSAVAAVGLAAGAAADVGTKAGAEAAGSSSPLVGASSSGAGMGIGIGIGIGAAAKLSRPAAAGLTASVSAGSGSGSGSHVNANVPAAAPWLSSAQMAALLALPAPWDTAGSAPATYAATWRFLASAL